MRKNSLPGLLLVFGIGLGAAFGHELGATIGTVSLKMDIGMAGHVRADVVVVETPRNYLYRGAFGWGGDESTPPRRVIAAINVSVNDRKLFIPLSSFVDLGDPRQVSLRPLENNEFTLRIVGGDAAGSYQASLEFTTKAIVSRKVTSGEFPTDVWEEDRYSFNKLRN
jgi:hypothetical protein